MICQDNGLGCMSLFRESIGAKQGYTISSHKRSLRTGKHEIHQKYDPINVLEELVTAVVKLAPNDARRFTNRFV